MNRTKFFAYLCFFGSTLSWATLPAYSATRNEYRIDKETFNGMVKIENKAKGLITIEPASRDRELTISCNALSNRVDGGTDRWMKLTVSASPQVFTNFSKHVGIDHASRITMDEKYGTVPKGKTVSIFVDHDNGSAVALELDCTLDLK